MNLQFIEAFADAATSVASSRLGVPVRRGVAAQGPPSHSISGIAALVGLTGDLQGRLVLDLDPRAASAVAGASRDERQGVAAFAEEVSSRALAALRGAGSCVEATPPMVFAGRHLEVTTTRLESMAVPIAVGGGTLVVSIAARGGSD